MLWLFVGGIIEGEIGEVWRGGIYAYTRDIFNLLDVSALLTMTVMLSCRLLLAQTDREDGGVDAALEGIAVTCQSLSAMSMWFRMLQTLNLSPTSGPLLLMAFRMMEEAMSNQNQKREQEPQWEQK